MDIIKEKLPNIGKVLSQKLEDIGINNSVDLKKYGSKNIFLKIKEIDKDICLNSLYALEGAIQGIRWHDLDKTTKQELKNFFYSELELK